MPATRRAMRTIALATAGFLVTFAALTARAGLSDDRSSLALPGPTPTHVVFLSFIEKRHFVPPPPLEVMESGWLRPKPEFHPCLWGSHLLEDDTGSIVAWIQSEVITDWDLYENRYVLVRGATETPISGCETRIIVTIIQVLIDPTPTPMPTPTATPQPTPTPTPRPPD